METKKESPDLHEDVRNRKTTLPKARVEKKRREKRKAMQAKADAAPEPTGDAWRIICGDALTELRRVTARPRLIFADPPYNIGIDYGDGVDADRMADDEYLEWAEGWIRLCKSVVADDGSLWVLIGDEYAAEYCTILKRYFTIRSWIKWYEIFGVNCSYKFNRCSRHLFYCTANPKSFVFNADAVTRPSDRQAKYGDSRAAPGGKIWDDVWQIPRLVGTAKERIPDFPTQLPLALLAPIIADFRSPPNFLAGPPLFVTRS